MNEIKATTYYNFYGRSFTPCQKVGFVLKTESSWDFYFSKTSNMVLSLGKTEKGSMGTYFGDIKHFFKYMEVKHEKISRF